MQRLILVVLLVLGSVLCAMAAAYLPNTSVQVFTPDGRATVAITAKSVTASKATRTAWKIRSTVDCIYRVLPTSAKGSYPAVPILAYTPETNGVNIATPFLNHSGCVGVREEM